jgi:hypothetical protein
MIQMYPNVDVYDLTDEQMEKISSEELLYKHTLNDVKRANRHFQLTKIFYLISTILLLSSLTVMSKIGIFSVVNYTLLSLLTVSIVLTVGYHREYNISRDLLTFGFTIHRSLDDENGNPILNTYNKNIVRDAFVKIKSEQFRDHCLKLLHKI